MNEMEIIKNHPCSRVWIDRGYIYKWQPKFLTENEIWCLEEMFHTGFVPYAERVELEIIRMEFIATERPSSATQLLNNANKALKALAECGIRHGDLTRPNVLIKDNFPILLDFSESRLADDPRPDKRPEGDHYWLMRTIRGVANGS